MPVRIGMAAIVAAACTAAIAAIATGAPPDTPVASRGSPATAEEVTKSLTRMNGLLDEAIEKVERKGADHVNLNPFAVGIESDKGTVRLAVAQALFLSNVWLELDRVDRELGYANGYAAGGDKPGPTEEKVRKSLDGARDALGDLERQLMRGGETRQDVYGDLAAIGKKLKKLQREVKRDGVRDNDIAAAAKDVEGDKLSFIRRFYDQRVFFGLKFIDFFRELSCVDAELEEARGLDAASDGKESGKVLRALKQARKCKEKIESAVRETLAAPLSISPINASFVDAQRSTTYTVSVDEQPSTLVQYQWSLTLQAVDPSKGVDQGCTNRGVFGATTVDFVWRHGNVGDPVSDDGCDHNLQGQYGHQGLIGLIVSDNRGWTCTATYKGTNSSDANSVQNGVASAPDCKRG